MYPLARPLFWNVTCTIQPYQTLTHWTFKIMASPCNFLLTAVYREGRKLNYEVSNK